MQDPPDDCYLWRTSHIIRGPRTSHISFLSLRTWQCDFRNSRFRHEAEDSTLLVKEVAKIQTQTCWAFCCIRLPRYQTVFSPPTNKRAALPLRPSGGFQSGAAAGRLKLPEQGDEKAEPVEWERKY